MLSLIGQLQHACRMVKPGRSFLRRMIDISITTTELHHHIRLNKGFRSDLEWWPMFLEEWNGVQMMSSLGRGAPDMVVTSDASGWGCGAFLSTWKWFQCSWPPVWACIHITVKELVPVVMACALWGEELCGKTVECRTDNAAIINKGQSKMPLAMHLMRGLFFFAARFNLSVYAVHLPRVQNVAADMHYVSRDDAAAFFHQVPMVCKEPVQVPLELQQLLIANQPDWTSRAWRCLLGTIFMKGLAESTQLTYLSGKKRYLSFCTRAGVAPVPVGEKLLCSFVAFLAKEGLKYRTIKVYLLAVRHLHIEQTLPDPFAGGPTPRICHPWDQKAGDGRR